MLPAFLLLVAGSASASLLAAEPPLAAPGSDAPCAIDDVAALPRATRVNDADGDKVYDDLEARFVSTRALRLPVIVSFVSGVPTEQGLARARAEAPGAPVRDAFHLIPAYAGDLSLTETLRIARLADVRQIEFDHPGALEMDSARLHMGVEAVVDEMDVTGDLDGDPTSFSDDDVGIAVLDSGIHGDHVDFADGKIIHWKDFGGTGRAPYDTDGHGTHVASIAAGLGGADPTLRGVAPGASIIGIRLTGGASTAIKAYEYVVDKRAQYNIRVATMSLGYGMATDGTSALERAVDETWQAGIVTIKSVGNAGPEKNTLTVPSAARGVIAVGALVDPGRAKQNLQGSGEDRNLADNFGFQLANFSSRGPTSDGRNKPDITAPGVAIRAAQKDTTNGYIEKSGTSMAAPFIAGAAALILAANPQLDPDEVRDILFETSEDWGPQGPDSDYGVGRAQIREAVREAFLRAGIRPPQSTPPPVPFHEVRTGTVATGSAEGTFVVNDTVNPIAATFLVEGNIIAAEVRAPNEAVVGHLATPVPGRQQSLGFQPTIGGTYTYRIVAPPGTSYVVDVSHGTVPQLPEFNLTELEGALGELPAPAQTPGPSAALLVGVVVLFAVAMRSRRRG